MVFFLSLFLSPPLFYLFAGLSFHPITMMGDDKELILKIQVPHMGILKVQAWLPALFIYDYAYTLLLLFRLLSCSY